MFYFMFCMLSENFRYLCYHYKMTIFDWHGNIDVIMKRINNYYLKQLTKEHVVIIGNVQRLIELRYDLNI